MNFYWPPQALGNLTLNAGQTRAIASSSIRAHRWSRIHRHEIPRVPQPQELSLPQNTFSFYWSAIGNNFNLPPPQSLPSEVAWSSKTCHPPSPSQHKRVPAIADAQDSQTPLQRTGHPNHIEAAAAAAASKMLCTCVPQSGCSAGFCP